MARFSPSVLTGDSSDRTTVSSWTFASVVETDDGAFIHTHYSGIVDMTKEQADQFRAGDLPKGLSLYTTPRFETSHEKYQWLPRIQVAGRGGVEPEGDRFKVTYSWYALTA